MTGIWPLEIRLSASRDHLRVVFDNQEIREWTAEKLRVESPSAEVQGHHPSQKITLLGKQNVKILKLEPVGNYALRIVFDDGHDTGIYTWDYLYKTS